MAFDGDCADRPAATPCWPIAPPGRMLVRMCNGIHHLSVVCGLVSVLTGISPTGAFAQDARVQWLREHLVAIDNGAAPFNADAFAPIARAIGDARIVQLGEGTHGDGTAFVIRSQLLRALHQHMGFDRLAFESGFFDCRDTDSLLHETDEPVAEAIDRGIYDIWAHSAQIQPLFQWVRATRTSGRPVRLGCFDVQFSSATAPERLLLQLEDALGVSRRTALRPDERAQLGELVAAAAAAGASELTEAEVRGFTTLLTTLERRITSLASPDVAWWTRVLDGLGARVRALAHRALAPPFNPRDPDRTVRSPHMILASNERDAAMARHVRWLADTAWSGSRVMLWAANSHVAAWSARTAVEPISEGEAPPRYVPLGARLRQSHGAHVYTILTVPYEGTWAAPSIRTADGELQWSEGTYDPAAPGTLAALLHETGVWAGVLDVRVIRDDPDHWLHRPIVVREDVFGGQAVRLADVLDAVLFIDVMSPSTPRMPGR